MSEKEIKEMVREWYSANYKDYFFATPDEAFHKGLYEGAELMNKENHALRLAVLEFMNMASMSEKAFEFLALSAGIEFKNGTWILKEGE